MSGSYRYGSYDSSSNIEPPPDESTPLAALLYVGVIIAFLRILLE